MKNKPLVSGIIIFLNANKFIQEAIESVFAQTYNNWELFLVDDGSTDGSTQIALRYAEQHPEKVHYLEHRGHQNRGMSASRNLGISHAKGEYIAFLDADDVWLPHKLEQQVAILDSHPDAAMLYGRTQYWHSWTGNPKDAKRDFVLDLGVQADTLFEPPTLLSLLYPLGNAPTPSSSNFLLRREIVERIGKFEEPFKGIYEDQAFMVKVYLKEPVFVASECWDRYRQHLGSCSALIQRAEHRSVRLYFLNWLAEYLYKQDLKDPEVWKLLRQNQRFAQLLVHMQKREWKQAIRGLLVLLRYHPEVIDHAYQNLRTRALIHARRWLRA
jgi:glycosyltransferase involved in cell wall biosynthesis